VPQSLTRLSEYSGCRGFFLYCVSKRTIWLIRYPAILFHRKTTVTQSILAVTWVVDLQHIMAYCESRWIDIFQWFECKERKKMILRFSEVSSFDLSWFHNFRSDRKISMYLWSITSVASHQSALIELAMCRSNHNNSTFFYKKNHTIFTPSYQLRIIHKINNTHSAGCPGLLPRKSILPPK
jgi:hypothetical protein